MGLAYCILAHKNPIQIARLVKAIAHPENFYVLHYEKRAPRAEHEALEQFARETPNLHLLPSKPIIWGRFSVVAAQLEGMERALQSGNRWSHFITLSGQDFPLKPQKEIVQELESAAGSSFLSFFDPFAEPVWNNVQDRVSRVYIESPMLEQLLKVPFVGRHLRGLFGWTNRMPSVPFVRRGRPTWFRYMGGSNHIILSRDAALYITLDGAARRIIRWLRHSGIPDESLFQSVLLNSPFADSVINDDRRAIFWERLGAPSPVTLTMEHLPFLREAREKGKLFARKFDSSTDNEVLCEMEKQIGL